MIVHLPGNDEPDATPLTHEDMQGLRPTYIATRNDLNFAEQANIERATRKYFRSSRLNVQNLLQIRNVNRIHADMFGDVWTWAGKQRTRDTDIGVDPSRIISDMKILFDDCLHWHDNEVFSPIERGVRLHHRLVSIHPYVNGNGRHARFVADLYLHKTVGQRFSWGAGDDGARASHNNTADESENESPSKLEKQSLVRKRYISALQHADQHNYEPLIEFATH